MRGRILLLVTILSVCAAVAFRLTIVSQFATSSPDGDQYYALSQSLLRDGSFRFGANAPPTCARLPGYPLFMAAVDLKPRAHDDHVHRAAFANALLDVATAVVVFLILWDRRLIGGAIGFAIVIVFPLLIVFSTFALTESLATFLTTACVWLLLRARERSSVRYGVGAGILFALAQLVRSDSVTLFVPIVAALAGLPAGRVRRRVTAALGLAAVIVFAPWPVRNLLTFGSPHPVGVEWPTQDGRPLPTGPIHWMRTWSSGQHGEASFADQVVHGRPFVGAAVLRPAMFDTPEEKARVLRLLDETGRAGLTPATNAEFLALARSRAIHHSIRTFVILPLKRVWRLISPLDARAIRWIRIRALGLPERYVIFPVSHLALFSFAIVGFAVLLRSPHHRSFAAVLGALALARMALHAFAVPHYVDARYLVEIVPVLAAAAAVGIVSLAYALARRRWPEVVAKPAPVSVPTGSTPS